MAGPPKSADNIDLTTDQGLLLCLKCRCCGHLTLDCSLAEWRPEFEWEYSEKRRMFTFDSPLTADGEDLCSRCVALDVLSMLSQRPPWRNQNALNKAFENPSGPIKFLGKTGTIEFKSNCQ